jgi:hypothetical protein
MASKLKTRDQGQQKQCQDDAYLKHGIIRITGVIEMPRLGAVGIRLAAISTTPVG